MENKPYVPKNRMSAVERAKQFAPFSPLNGLTKALREQERVQTPKPSLCDDQIAALNRQLQGLQPGQAAVVYYHRQGEMHRAAGIVKRLDPLGKRLALDGVSVAFDELLDIRSELP